MTPAQFKVRENFRNLDIFFNNYEELKKYLHLGCEKNLLNYQFIEINFYAGLGARKLILNLGCIVLKKNCAISQYFHHNKIIMNGDYFDTYINEEINNIIINELKIFDLDFELYFFGAFNDIYWNISIIKKMTVLLAETIHNQSLSLDKIDNLFIF